MQKVTETRQTFRRLKFSFVYSFRSHDEAIRSWPDEVKGIARNKCQYLLPIRFKHCHIIGLYDLGVNYPVTEPNFSVGKADDIILPYIPKRPEKCIAMGGKTDISRPAWPVGAFDVAYCSAQRSVARTFNNNGRNPKPRNLDSAHCSVLPDWIRLKIYPLFSKYRVLRLLKEFCVHQHKATIAKQY